MSEPMLRAVPAHDTGILRVDDVFVLRVLVDERAHDRAEVGDLLPVTAHVVEHLADHLGCDALATKLRVDGCSLQHEAIADAAVRDATDRGVSHDCRVDLALLFVDDGDVRVGLLVGVENLVDERYLILGESADAVWITGFIRVLELVPLGRGWVGHVDAPSRELDG